MFDTLAFIIGFFLICIISLSILVGVTFLNRLFNLKTPKVTNRYDEKENDNQLEQDSRDDSEGDGLVLFDDPMFPPEFDD
jgi:hypothetical protein